MKEFSAQEICANFSPQAIDADGIGNVLIRDKFSGMDFWVNVWTKCGEVMYEWNQYIFFDNDVEDMLRKEIQADNGVAEQAMSCSFDYLLKIRYIYKDKNGDCFLELPYIRYSKELERRECVRVYACNCLKKDGTLKKRVKLNGNTYTLIDK